MPVLDAIIFTLFVGKLDPSSIMAMDWSELLFWYDYCNIYSDAKADALKKAQNG